MALKRVHIIACFLVFCVIAKEEGDVQQDDEKVSFFFFLISSSILIFSRLAFGLWGAFL